jgi:hypothetical protein
MKKLKILITFDHELPLGGLKTNYSQALFEPTSMVIKLAGELNVSVNFFTDVLCALRFREWDNEGFYRPYIDQLKQIISLGHDVQLHLHPHWLTSDYKNGTYIPSNDFILADFKNKTYPDNIDGIVEKGTSFLNAAIQQEFPNYKCVAYRAGGYNLFPESGKIFSALYKNGIRFDSSICKGYYFKSAISEVNYFGLPSQPNWFIDKQGNYKAVSTEGILEIPILGKSKLEFKMPTSFKMKKLQSRAPISHGKQIHEGKPSGFFYKIKQSLSARMLSFDNYTYSPAYLMKVLDHNVNKYAEYETVMLSVIAHPKSMSDYCFNLMRSFIEQSKEKYGEKIQFCTYRQLYDELNFN